MARVFFSILFFCLSLLLRGQDYPEPPLTPKIQKEIERLKKALSSAKEDSTRVLLLYNITSWYAVNFSPKAKLQSSIELYNTALKTEFPRGLCLALYYRCSFYNVKDSIETMLNYARKLLSLAEKIRFKQGKGLGYLALAEYYGRLSDFEGMYTNANEAAAIFAEEDDLRNYTQATSMAGAASYRLGKYRQALKFYYSAVNGWKELGGRQYEASVSFRMANIFLLMGGNEKLAIEYCNRSVEMFNSINYWHTALNSQLVLGDAWLKMKQIDSALSIYKAVEKKINDPSFWDKMKIISGLDGERIATIQNDLRASLQQRYGHVFSETGNYDKSLQLFSETINYYRQQSESRIELPMLYSQVGDVYLKKAQDIVIRKVEAGAENYYLQSLENYHKAITGYKSMKIKVFYGETLLNVAAIYVQQGKKNVSRNYIKEALQTALTFNARSSIAKAYLLLSRHDSARGDFSAAYRNYKLYRVYADSVLADENSIQAEAAGIREDFRQREEELKIIAAENKSRADSQKQKRKFAYLLSGLVILGSGYGVYRYKRINKKRMEQRRLKERFVISQDLHDQVGSTLSSISIYSKVAQVEGERGNGEKMNELLERIRSTSSKIMNEMNDIVWAINPQNDTMTKVIRRMESFALPLLAARNIQFKFRYNKEVLSLNLEMEQRKNFYLIFKEAINNAVKYSGALILETDITCGHGILKLTVKDNGVGFNLDREMENAESLSGNGLKNMYARADEINANLRIESVFGSGTFVILIIPVF
jgi:signal transduction histidine kinase